MKKLSVLLLCVAMILSLAACGGSGGQQQSSSTPPSNSGGTSQSADSGSTEIVKIRVATSSADGNPMNDLIYYWQEQVDKLLPGRVEWENFPNSSIGTEREQIEMVIDGTLDAALVGPSNITAVAPSNAVRLQDMPFLFRSGEELYAAGEEWMNAKINEEGEPYGYTTIFYEYIMGQEIENNRNPIYTPEDVKGLKVRSYDSPGPYKFLEACGGLPVSLAFSELYSGLQQGAIDGVYTTTSNYVPQKLVEVCKYHTKLEITSLGMTMMFSLSSLNSYPQDVQDALFEAGKLTEKYCQEVVSPETKAKTYDEIAAAGVEINDVTDEQYEVFVKCVEDYCYNDLREEVGAELWDFCVEWLKEYRANH